MTVPRQARTSAESVPTLPSVHALHLAELVEDWGVPAERLLGELGLTREAVSDPAVRIPVPDFGHLIQCARKLTGEPGIGFHFGLKMRISAHGFVGFAAMTAANLRQAIELACQFAPTRTSALSLRLEQHGTEAALVIDEAYPLGEARDAIIIAFLLGLWKLANTITGQELPAAVDFAFAEPEYFSRFKALLAGRVRFSRPAHQLSFSASLLDLPLVEADPPALRLAQDQCERELTELRLRGGLHPQLEALLLPRGGGYRTLEQLAKELHTSPRTLKRKLSAQGTNYSKLLDRARCAEATRLLAAQLSIEEIASRLGYSDAANFTRAFRRWTGKTPAVARSAR